MLELPVGIIIGGSVGALVGAIVSSKVGNIAKEFGKTARKIGGEIK